MYLGILNEIDIKEYNCTGFFNHFKYLAPYLYYAIENKTSK